MSTSGASFLIELSSATATKTGRNRALVHLRTIRRSHRLPLPAFACNKKALGSSSDCAAVYVSEYPEKYVYGGIPASSLVITELIVWVIGYAVHCPHVGQVTETK